MRREALGEDEEGAAHIVHIPEYSNRPIGHKRSNVQ